MSAPCHVADCRAVSHGSRAGATVSAGSERVAGMAKAREVPNAMTSRKIGRVDVGWCSRRSRCAATVAASTASANGREAATVDPVGDGAGDEHEERRGCEFGQPEHAERELAAGHVEHQLAQHGAEQGHGGRRHEHRREQRDDRPRFALHRANLPPRGTVRAVRSGDDVRADRRARPGRHRRQWTRFGAAIGATVVLVLLFGAGPFELTGGADAGPQAAASVSALGDDTLRGPTTHRGATTTTPPPRPRHDRPPTTTPSPRPPRPSR